MLCGRLRKWRLTTRCRPFRRYLQLLQDLRTLRVQRLEPLLGRVIVVLRILFHNVGFEGRWLLFGGRVFGSYLSECLHLAQANCPSLVRDLELIAIDTLAIHCLWLLRRIRLHQSTHEVLAVVCDGDFSPLCLPGASVALMIDNHSVEFNSFAKTRTPIRVSTLFGLGNVAGDATVTALPPIYRQAGRMI